MLKKDAFQWSPNAEEAFNLLKQTVTSPPVLALPNCSAHYTLETNASGHGIGAVLMQQGHPIAFISKALSPKNLLLSTYERELLAIIYVVQKWSQYLLVIFD